MPSDPVSPSDNLTVELAIHRIVSEQLPLAGATILGSHTDLQQLGLDSMATVNLLLEIERQFDVTFPDELMSAETLATIDRIATVVQELTR